MRINKLIIAAIGITLFNIILGRLTCGGAFNWVYQLEPTNVWKPMGGQGPGLGFLAGSLGLNFLLALVYALLRKGIPGKTKWAKGLVFGVCVWTVGMLPGMFSTYVFMSVAAQVVLYWTILGLIRTPLEGMIIAAIYGE